MSDTYSDLFSKTQEREVFCYKYYIEKRRGKFKILPIF